MSSANGGPAWCRSPTYSLADELLLVDALGALSAFFGAGLAEEVSLFGVDSPDSLAEPLFLT